MSIILVKVIMIDKKKDCNDNSQNSISTDAILKIMSEISAKSGK